MVQCVLILIPRAGVALLLAKWEENALDLKGDRKKLALLCAMFLGLLRIFWVIMMNMAIDARKAQGWGAAVSMVFVSVLTTRYYRRSSTARPLRRGNSRPFKKKSGSGRNGPDGNRPGSGRRPIHRENRIWNFKQSDACHFHSENDRRFLRG